ncbi:MAG: tRNA (adenosine(37)-N6)-threonylcarbamoyltransferase complex transferase subunit TsaD, partial [Candidatus Bipolaricaulota bacterium]
KGVSWARNVPLLGVNHLAAHLFAHRLSYPEVEPPLLGMIVSGGHSSLVEVRDWDEYRIVGSTRDDAAGEALDKFGRLVGLGYPAGPKIDELAAQGDPQAISMPRPLLETGLDMSFAGLKTAAAYWLKKHSHFRLEDMCASYLEAVVDVLAEKVLRAARLLNIRHIAVVGGVAANRRLRETVPRRAGERGLDVYFPPVRLCTDNAAMVAACGHQRLVSQGQGDPLSLRPDAGLALSG